ncbi:unnamed protein product [Adineta steineri]|uniref:Uncharacterized protein n=1 Tax=Adineta steineri TaxID=433720 RepID=A0A814AIQ0_9BILA|nr:unnamed protein product [Adineta steineri]CAF0980828.1 unnamed protein product [Adineta steineri]CAF1094740.1 unnamed protein product [Adineta steineri]
MSYSIVFKHLFVTRILIGLIVVCAAVATNYVDQQKRAALSDLTSIEKLNQEFRHQYKQATEAFWRSQIENGSVIMVNGNSITLFHKGVPSSSSQTSPAVYHHLKSIAHIPMTIRFLLINNSSTLMNDTLKQYWQNLNNLQIPESIQSKEKASVDHIVSESQKLLREEMDKKGSIDREMLRNFCQSLTHDLTILLDAAAIAQLNEMHEIIQDWMREYNFDPKDPSLKVLIIGPRAAREKNLHATYFERLLGDERTRNIVYIEELFRDEEKARSIFSSWFLARELGDSFFNDKDRMHRDLLMTESAQKHINQLIAS